MLESPPTLQRSADRHLVRVLEVSAHRKTARETSYPYPASGEQLRDVHRRRLAFEIRIRREDELLDPAATYARDQLRDLQIIGPYAVHGRDRAVQDVVTALVLTGPFDGEDIERLLDHAHEAAVALVG